MDMFIFL